MAIGLVLWLLLAKGLASEGAAGVTFSSRLVHRFSEEAKAHLASRGNGSVLQPWPKRNSSEYFRLLLRSDETRQRMRLGSQYESLYLSGGSQTYFYGNELSWLHYAWIDIGTPNVSFLVALDAGSDLFWVPCDCIECASLSADNYNNVMDRDLNQYRPSLSSTSRHLPCGHQLCNQSSHCTSSKDPCPYFVKYYSDNTSSSGYLFEDKLHLASDGRHSIQKSVQASIILGCGSKQTGDYLQGAAPDGLLGLGTGNISVPSLLAKAGLIQNSFSICFDENESGRIIFGDQGHVTQHSTSFLPEEGEFITYIVGVESFCVGSLCLKETKFKAVIDSGSGFTYLPNKVYQKVVTEFDRQVNSTRIIYQQPSWEYCYSASSQELINFPPLKLAFSRNQTFLIQNPMLLFTGSDYPDFFCLAVMRVDDDDYATIGQNFLMGYRMVFDRENLLFGWSRWNCQDTASLTSPSIGGSPNPLPANQQQSIPNARAVPPAVAGHASPKPAAAAPGLTSRLSLASLLLICHLWLWLSC
ncbi:aspartic proteinase-like protein 1 [Cajanus cajan]|uniref:Aspartic proteinase-like protein 1 n=1 Tax=Cajanus cajan TaxID=3821 RepID=A0A151TZM9_CAJCA|nr:aspartic proteinase-like protein 1 [Cajanus cajan]KYP72500.1 Aspartic proteinase-like protein 1 [Cajanus cajan]